MKIARICFLSVLAAGAAFAADLTGNWVVPNPNGDPTAPRVYFDLKQEGTRITGHIRVTQFYYAITESTGGPDGFTITGSMTDGHNARIWSKWRVRRLGWGWAMPT